MGTKQQKILKMKIAATLVALAAAQAPPESKTCPDCQNWHTAANAVVDANPNLLQEWAIAVGKEQCSVIWQDDALCDILSEEDSSTGQNPGSREWTVTHGAALTLCALKKLDPALWEKHLKWPTHALPAKISGTTI